MPCNESRTDRIIRVILAAALLAAWGFGVVQGTLAIIFAVVAAILLLTAVTGFCPLYRLVGINTCKSQQSRA